MLKELRRRAAEKREEIYHDENSSDTDKEIIDDIVKFFAKEEGIKLVPKSTVFQIFIFLDYYSKEGNIKLYMSMYDILLAEINKTYIYVDPNHFKDRNND